MTTIGPTRLCGYRSQPRRARVLRASRPPVPNTSRITAPERVGGTGRCHLAMLAVCLATAWTPGCGGDARVELSASDSIESRADALELAVQEYHPDVAAGDDLRESAAIAAFVNRIRAAADNPAEQDRHVAAFTAALARTRQDRRVEWARFTATQDNLDTLREITGGLRRLAIESLTLSDEARRYIRALLDLRRSAPRTGTGRDYPPPG